MDLDFVQPPRTWFDSAYGTMLEVYVYPMGTTDGSTVTPKLYIGADGQTPTKEITLFKDSSNSKRYYTYLVGSGYDNKYANLYLSVKRGSLAGYVTRPIEKFSTVPSKFYRVYNPDSACKINPFKFPLNSKRIFTTNGELMCIS